MLVKLFLSFPLRIIWKIHLIFTQLEKELSVLTPEISARVYALFNLLHLKMQMYQKVSRQNFPTFINVKLFTIFTHLDPLFSQTCTSWIYKGEKTIFRQQCNFMRQTSIIVRSSVWADLHGSAGQWVCTTTAAAASQYLSSVATNTLEICKP